MNTAQRQEAQRRLRNISTHAAALSSVLDSAGPHGNPKTVDERTADDATASRILGQLVDDVEAVTLALHDSEPPKGP
ncbi:MAG TPA: hypothetical protein VHE30_25950 [Polyangiaceae bacterium]|nr:hypothetical protein [Polyangiaceae bacterium]